MTASKVFFTSLRTNPHSNLLDKMERLVRRAGIDTIDFDKRFAAIKIHFGEPGNVAYIRPNFAARMADILRSLGAKPFLTDCNTLYSGRRSNAVDHLQSAMENGFNPISARCNVIIADGLKGTDYREIPIDGEYCKDRGIQTSFVKRGRPSLEKKENDIIRNELARIRATRMEGSFGTQKEHYGLKRIKARTKLTEILYIFFGIHTANAVQLVRREVNEIAQAA